MNLAYQNYNISPCCCCWWLSGNPQETYRRHRSDWIFNVLVMWGLYLLHSLCKHFKTWDNKYKLASYITKHLQHFSSYAVSSTVIYVGLQSITNIRNNKKKYDYHLWLCGNGITFHSVTTTHVSLAAPQPLTDSQSLLLDNPKEVFHSSDKQSDWTKYCQESELEVASADSHSTI